MMVKFSVFK